MIFLFVAVIAAVVTFIASRIVLAIALKHGIHPPVRDRDVHVRPTPRLGGVAILVGVIAAFGVASQLPDFGGVFAEPTRVWAILGASAAVCSIGVIDDLFDLDWMLRLGAQLLIAGLVAIYGVQIVSLPLAGLTVPSSQMSIAMTVLVIVLVMNAVNFTDGLDGLVAGTTIIGAVAFWIYIWTIRSEFAQENAFFSLASLISATIIGVCIGFLPVNWHRAKMFMGDGGAYTLGLLTASSAIAVTGQIDVGTMGGRSQILPAFIPILLPLAILLLPLTDLVLAVIRRIANGNSPFAADRKHLHHRLLDMGHSHLGAVLIFYAWTAVVCIGCLLFLRVEPWLAVITMVVGFIVCAVLTAAPVGRRVWRTTLRVLRERREAKKTQLGHTEQAEVASESRIRTDAGQRSPTAS